jgi:hypothetical protein
LIIVLFNYDFSTAEVNAVSSDMGASLSVISMSIGVLVGYVCRDKSVEL